MCPEAHWLAGAAQVVRFFEIVTNPANQPVYAYKPAPPKQPAVLATGIVTTK